MTDTATPDVEAELEKIAATTKKGFDLQARVKGRGLRRANITLFLDEDKGPELGWAHDLVDANGSPIDALGRKYGRVREGVVGELDAAAEELEQLLNHKGVPQVDAEGRRLELVEKIKSLEAKRDELVAELTKSAIVIHMRAVPPIIEEDTVRLARDTLEITEKGIPEAMTQKFKDAKLAHLMTLMFQRVIDNATGEVNEKTSYEDAMTLIGWLPPGQFQRLDMAMGRVQFTDAISREIEGQEDFS